MIIAKITGGLGNQLFQYAAGRRLASIHNTELKLDVSSFETYKLHRYSLNYLAIKAPEASRAEIEALRGNMEGGKLSKLVERLRRRKLFPKNPHYIKEVDQGFNPKILDLPDDVYLDGYWQNEKYFKDREILIREEYVLKEPLSGESNNLSERILSSNSVSIHVRRADYVANQANQKIYEILGPDYYSKSIEAVKNQVEDPQGFIFSDDISWVRENFKLDLPTFYVDFNGPEKNYEDMYLMSLCRHHIIANSSFSWWGAWLGNNSDKLVFAPKHWYRNRVLDNKNSYPDGWIKI